jgi:thermitase
MVVGNEWSVEIGVRFRTTVPGYVTGVRFYKPSGASGTHVGSLWSETGARLADAVFAGETASGWQQVSFAAPVPVAAGVTYVASYHAPTGHYAATLGYFGAEVSSGPLRAPAGGGADGGNGVHYYATSPTFPTATYSATNYWVDVVFTPLLTPTGTPTTTQTATATTTSTPSPTTIGTQGGLIIPGEVIVQLAEGVDLVDIADQFAINPTPIDQLGPGGLYRVQILDGAPPEVRAAALHADPRIAFAEANVVAQSEQDSSWASGDPTSYSTTQWAPVIMGVPAAHTVTRGAGVTVAVLDTGIDFAHPAFAGRLVPGYDFVGHDADPREEGAPGLGARFGHGTHVAGLVALIAPDAKIMPVRVLDQNGVGNAWQLAKAMAWASNPDGNPATNDGAAVINLSLNTLTSTRVVSRIVARSWAVTVAAAGNNGTSDIQYPAGESTRILSVAATTAGDTLAPFSSYGAWVQVAAPGQAIVSTVPGGGYAAWSGTSMATGLVSGQVALLRAAAPQMTDVDAIIARIKTTARNIGGLVPLRVDAAAAVGVVATPTATATPTGTPTETATETPSGTPTETPTDVATETASETPTGTATETSTETPTSTDTPTATATVTVTDTPTETPSETPTGTATETPTDTPTDTPTETPSETPTDTPTDVPTGTPTETATETPTDTPTDTPTQTPTETPTATLTPTMTATQTDAPTETEPGTATGTATATEQ